MPGPVDGQLCPLDWLLAQGTKDVERQTTSITNRTGDSSSAPTHEEPRTAGVPADRERHGKRDLADAKSSEVRRDRTSRAGFGIPFACPLDIFAQMERCCDEQGLLQRWQVHRS